MTYLIKVLVGCLSGIFISMGMGGGSIFIIYLTLVEQYSQISAQSANLFLFIPSALVAIFMYKKKKLIKWKVTLPLILWGILGAIIGATLTHFLDKYKQQKIFALFLIIMSIKIFKNK